MLIADVSHHIKVNDWDKVKKSCPFLISKATQGTWLVDEYLDEFIKGCEKYKIPYFLYSFIEYASDGEEQAKFLVKKTESKVGKYFIGYAIDAELNSENSTRVEIRGKLPKESEVRKAIMYIKKLGGKCLFYGNDYPDIIKDVRDDKCAIWYPRYGENTGVYNPAYPVKSVYKPYADLHQYTSKGICPGIASKCDLNRITGIGKDLSWFTTKIEKEADNVATKETKYTAQAAIEIALSQDGYLEKKSNSQLTSKTANAGKNNYTRYEKEVFGSNGNYWCASFISWVFWMLCEKDKTKAKEICLTLTMGADTFRQAFIKAKLYGSKPKLGALIFFSGTRHAGANHIAMVYKYDKKYVYTVEGNTSSDSGVVDNGGAVNCKKYLLTNSKILGYGYPKYDSDSSTSTSSSTSTTSKKKYSGSFPKLPTRGYFKNGDVSSEVCKLKKFLNWFGNYKLTETNKNYFDKTVSAVKDFQKKNGLTVDGEFGSKSLAKAKTVMK